MNFFLMENESHLLRPGHKIHNSIKIDENFI
jgi:hypothetical protein